MVELKNRTSIHFKMLTSKYLLIGATLLIFFLIETNQQLIVGKVHVCNLFCGDDDVIDFKTCTCVQRKANESERKIRSLDRVSVSKLIRGDEFTSQSSNHRCSNDELWNGRTCISSISLCPGGYHWNGRACIIQSSIQTAALVPSDPDKKCKYAQQREEELTQRSYEHLPATVAPTISTSPMCPFGFIWSDKGCLKSAPICPSGYFYSGNSCHLNARHTTDTMPEMTTKKARNEATHLIGEISRKTRIESNKWQQKPHEDIVNVEMRAEHSDVGEPCCSIMSPRICQRIPSQLNEQWKCYHHKHRLCGDICTKPNLFLRPKQFSFIEQILIMPPPPPRLMKLIQNHAHRDTNIGK